MVLAAFFDIESMKHAEHKLSPEYLFVYATCGLPHLLQEFETGASAESDIGLHLYNHTNQLVIVQSVQNSAESDIGLHLLSQPRSYCKPPRFHIG